MVLPGGLAHVESEVQTDLGPIECLHPPGLGPPWPAPPSPGPPSAPGSSGTTCGPLSRRRA
eukprot:7410518-Pyramimonas_sp.AAC.1